MLTRSGWFVVLGGLATLVGARLFALPELFVIGACALLLPVTAVVWVRRPLPVLQAERTVHPRRVHLGGPSRVELRIGNAGRRRSPVLALHDPVQHTVGARVALAPLAPGLHQEAGYRLPTERRGVVRIGPLSAELTDPFGLARRRFGVAGDSALTVLPGVDLLSGVPVGGGRDEPLAGVVRRSVTGGGADDLATLRPYVVGDDLRRVHWASTARTGELVVRQDDERWQGHLTLLLDTRPERIGPAQFEVAVSAAASVLHAAGRNGDRARLLFADGTDTGLVDAQSSGDLLLEHLAVAERNAEGARSGLPVDGRSLTGTLVVVSGTPTADDLASLASSPDAFGSVLVVAIAPSAASLTAADPPVPVAPPGIDVVVVDAGHPFPAAWAAAVERSRVQRR